MDKKYHMGVGDFMGDRDDIIREIRKLSDVGKRILLMKYEFENSDFYKANIKIIKEEETKKE